MNFFEYLVSLFFGQKPPQPHVADSTQPKTQLTMKELISKIHLEIINLNENLNKYEQGNKAAGQRARKTSKELEKLFKEFRKRSVHESVEA